MDEIFYIIVPFHNEENNIERFLTTANKELESFTNFRILFIDDGSTDNTWKKISELFDKNKFINGLKLSKNFGKEAAIEAGLNFIEKKNKFKFAIIIDCDLQHPIDKIPELIHYWKKNYKIVTTFKINNVENLIRKFGSDLFYYIMKNFSDAKFITKNTDYLLLDKEVVNIFNNMKEKNKSVKTFVNWIGYKNKSIEIKISKRSDDKSKFTFFNLIRTAVNEITSFSLFPIKVVGYLGLTMSIISLILIPSLFLLNFFKIIFVSVQTLIILFNIFLTGIILSSLGLLGIYISKIHANSIDRPSYIIEDEKIK